ncbi:MAG: zinc ABC transporter substrate-binding protein, partial [Actinobacteria bacterium]|nr:zinc ABC transporter substrate-binding protein [Actinomycetota bacterium]
MGDACPTAPVPVVVSVDQWGDIVRQLGGACAEVTIVVAGTSIDPHDYEPTTGDIAKFTGARLVVVNGADYDPWAERAVEALPAAPTVIDAAEVNGVEGGVNPHLWYSPDYVEATAAAVTAALKDAAPAASSYFDTQAAAWQDSMKPYFAQIAAVKSAASGATYGATESVFDYMAQACGLVNTTPQGYQNTAAAESDPAPGDVLAFNTALTDGTMQVLIYNTQTEGAIPEQINATATQAGVPIVDVTETVAPGFTTFADWQISQLQALATAL